MKPEQDKIYRLRLINKSLPTVIAAENVDWKTVYDLFLQEKKSSELVIEFFDGKKWRELFTPNPQTYKPKDTYGYTWGLYKFDPDYLSTLPFQQRFVVRDCSWPEENISLEQDYSIFGLDQVHCFIIDNQIRIFNDGYIVDRTYRASSKAPFTTILYAQKGEEECEMISETAKFKDKNDLKLRLFK